MSVAGGTELGDSERVIPQPTGPADESARRDAAAVRARAADRGIEDPGDLDDEVVRTRSRSQPSRTLLLLAAILVAALANVVMAWLVLGSTIQLRDQSTAANGLQRCLIRAQLGENSTTDPNGTAYKAAVGACIAK